MPASIDAIPDLQGTSFDDAHTWISALWDAGIGGWHADDDPLEFVDLFEPAAGLKVRSIMSKLHAASADWEDPDVLYQLVGDGRPEAEVAWPGFILDLSMPSGRLGNPSLKGRKLPNLVFEEANQFFLVEFPAVGKASFAGSVTVYRLNGAGFDSSSNVDLKAAIVDEASAFEASPTCSNVELAAALMLQSPGLGRI